MSMEGLQEVLCRSAVDRAFLLLLASAPHKALAGFDLDGAERAVVAEPPVRSLEELAVRVEAWRKRGVRIDAASRLSGTCQAGVMARAVPRAGGDPRDTSGGQHPDRRG